MFVTMKAELFTITQNLHDLYGGTITKDNLTAGIRHTKPTRQSAMNALREAWNQQQARHATTIQFREI
jgi:hypothetical protein